MGPPLRPEVPAHTVHVSSSRETSVKLVEHVIVTHFFLLWKQDNVLFPPSTNVYHSIKLF
jgi:hypothetical protein